MKILNAIFFAAVASENAYEYDFTNVFEAHDFITTTADQIFGSKTFKTDGIYFVSK